MNVLSTPEVSGELEAYQRVAEGMQKSDVTHINTLEILKAREGMPAAFARGNLLLSSPSIRRLFVLDFDGRRITWSGKGVCRGQHHPTINSAGEMLLFDNYGAAENRSCILTLDVATGKLLRTYGDEPDRRFFTRCCGRVHQLERGNLLIVGSMEGYAFEVTPAREIVWEFRSPQRLGGKVPVVGDVLRLDPSYFDASFRKLVESRAH